MLEEYSLWNDYANPTLKRRRETGFGRRCVRAKRAHDKASPDHLCVESSDDDVLSILFYLYM